MPTTQPETNGTWTGRARVAGVLNESKGGFRTKTEAKTWAREREDAVKNRHRARGKGPSRTTVGEALLTLSKETLPFLKAAEKDVNRINTWLRLANLPTLEVIPCKGDPAPDAMAPSEGAPLVYFNVLEKPLEEAQQIVPSLQEHRAQLAKRGVKSQAIMRKLANSYVSDVSPADLNDLVNARKAEGKSASTVRHDVHTIRSMINKVRNARSTSAVIAYGFWRFCLCKTLQMGVEPRLYWVFSGSM